MLRIHGSVTIPGMAWCQTGFGFLPAHGLVMTGGYGGGSPRSGSLAAQDSNTFDTTTFPELPFAVRKHCMVALETRNAIVAGQRYVCWYNLYVKDRPQIFHSQKAKLSLSVFCHLAFIPFHHKVFSCSNQSAALEVTINGIFLLL